jgi:hypothetical protein
LRPIILLVIGLVSVVGGVLVARNPWFGLKPTPEFAALAEQPDRSLVGTVAYIESGSAQGCVSIVSAAGTPTEQLQCFDNSPQALVWLPDGRLEVSGYGKVEDPDDGWCTIIDVATGTTEEVPQAEIPQQAPSIHTQGPNGERIDSTTENGQLRVTLMDASGTRELLSVGAPTTYTLAWNPDGTWFVVKDDLDQILLITPEDPSVTRVLVQGGFAQAATDLEVVQPAE